MAAHGDTKLEEFRADALTVGTIAVIAETSPIEKPSLSNTFEIKAGAEGALQDLQVKGGGVESVSGTSGSTFTSSIFEALREKDKQRREANSQLITFLDMLNALERQIAMLDAQIEEYEDEIVELKEQLGALEELRDLAESGELDPTNPEHMRLLELSGIPRDQWGVVTVDMIDDRIQTTKDRIEDLEEKIRKAKSTKTKLEKDRDDLYAKRDASSDADNDPEIREIADNARSDFYEAERQLSESESEWFHRVISVAPKGDWDGLIDKLEDISVSDLRFDDSLSLEVRDYLMVYEFEERFEKYCDDVPAEEHHFVLMDILENDLEPQDLQTLIRSSETPEYIRAAINELGLATPDQTQDPHLGRDQ